MATVRESHRRAALLGTVATISWGDGAADIHPPRAPAILFETSHTFSVPCYREEDCQNAIQLLDFSPRPGECLNICRTLIVVPGVFLLDRSKSGWMGITGRDSGCARRERHFLARSGCLWIANGFRGQ
jgi:hypothetical protein